MTAWSSSSTMPCHAPTMRAGLPYQTHGIRQHIRTSHLRLTCTCCTHLHISPHGPRAVPGKLDPKQTLNLPPAAQPVTLRGCSIREQTDRPARQTDKREVKRETVHIHTCPPPPRRSFPSPSISQTPRPFLPHFIHLSSIAAASGKFLYHQTPIPSLLLLLNPPPPIAPALALRCSTTPESIGSQIHSFSCKPTIIHTFTHNHNHASRS
jgi:hypothetical protein